MEVGRCSLPLCHDINSKLRRLRRRTSVRTKRILVSLARVSCVKQEVQLSLQKGRPYAGVQRLANVDEGSVKYPV